MTAFPDEDSCLDHLENIRWKDGITSPFDPESKVYKCKNHRYKCKNTGKYFNVKTNTLFEGTRIPLQKWFIATWMFLTHKKGVPSCQLARFRSHPKDGMVHATSYQALFLVRE